MKVVGVGHPLGGDDGVGRVVARALRALGVDAVEVCDGAGLLDVLLAVEGDVVVVDAVVGGGAPGTVLELSAAELAERPRPVSSHGLGVAAALTMAEALGARARVRIVAVAIEPPVALAEGLSGPVARAVEEVIARIGRPG